MRENVIREKSFAFAIRCVNLARHLREDKNEYVLSKQILRSGTSIGANVREAIYAQTKPDFGMKMSIAQKETAETEYWLELLEATGYISPQESSSLLDDCRELLKIIVAITKTIYNK